MIRLLLVACLAHVFVADGYLYFSIPSYGPITGATLPTSNASQRLTASLVCSDGDMFIQCGNGPIVRSTGFYMPEPSIFLGARFNVSKWAGTAAVCLYGRDRITNVSNTFPALFNTTLVEEAFTYLMSYHADEYNHTAPNSRRIAIRWSEPVIGQVEWPQETVALPVTYTADGLVTTHTFTVSGFQSTTQVKVGAFTADIPLIGSPADPLGMTTDGKLFIQETNGSQTAFIDVFFTQPLVDTNFTLFDNITMWVRSVPLYNCWLSTGSYAHDDAIRVHVHPRYTLPTRMLRISWTPPGSVSVPNQVTVTDFRGVTLHPLVGFVYLTQTDDIAPRIAYCRAVVGIPAVVCAFTEPAVSVNASQVVFTGSTNVRAVSASTTPDEFSGLMLGTPSRDVWEVTITLNRTFDVAGDIAATTVSLVAVDIRGNTVVVTNQSIETTSSFECANPTTVFTNVTMRGSATVNGALGRGAFSAFVYFVHDSNSMSPYISVWNGTASTNVSLPMLNDGAFLAVSDTRLYIAGRDFDGAAVICVATINSTGLPGPFQIMSTPEVTTFVSGFFVTPFVGGPGVDALLVVRSGGMHQYLYNSSMVLVRTDAMGWSGASSVALSPDGEMLSVAAAPTLTILRRQSNGYFQGALGAQTFASFRGTLRTIASTNSAVYTYSQDSAVGSRGYIAWTDRSPSTGLMEPLRHAFYAPTSPWLSSGALMAVSDPVSLPGWTPIGRFRILYIALRVGSGTETYSYPLDPVTGEPGLTVVEPVPGRFDYVRVSTTQGNPGSLFFTPTGAIVASGRITTLVRKFPPSLAMVVPSLSTPLTTNFSFVTAETLSSLRVTLSRPGITDTVLEVCPAGCDAGSVTATNYQLVSGPALSNGQYAVSSYGDVLEACLSTASSPLAGVNANVAPRSPIIHTVNGTLFGAQPIINYTLQSIPIGDVVSTLFVPAGANGSLPSGAYETIVWHEVNDSGTVSIVTSYPITILVDGDAAAPVFNSCVVDMYGLATLVYSTPEPASAVWVAFNETVFPLTGNNLTIVGVPDGIYNVSLFYDDEWANRSPAASREVLVDTFFPSPTIETANSSVVGRFVAFSFRFYRMPANGSVNVEISNDTATRLVAFTVATFVANTSVEFIDTAPLSSGSYRVRVAYENVVSDLTVVVVDSTAAAATFTALTFFTNGTAFVAYEIPEPASQISLSIGPSILFAANLSRLSVAATFNATGVVASSDGLFLTGPASIPDGVYNATLAYTDVYGNIAAGTSRLNVVVDAVVEPAVILSPANGTVASVSTLVVFSVSVPTEAAPGSVTLRFIARPETPWAVSANLTLATNATGGVLNLTGILASSWITASTTGGVLAEGNYSLDLVYIDAFGRRSPSVPSPHIFSLDLTTQSPVVVLPTANTSYTKIPFQFTFPERQNVNPAAIVQFGTVSGGGAFVPVYSLVLETAPDGFTFLFDPVDARAPLVGVNRFTPTNVSVLPDNTYRVLISYRDRWDLHARATRQIDGVRVDNTGSPAVLAIDALVPAVFTASITIPEAMQPGSGLLSFSRNGVVVVVQLNNTFSGTADAVVDTTDLMSSGQPLTGPAPGNATTLSSGRYNISLAYTDAMGNVAPPTTLSVFIDNVRPVMQAASYSQGDAFVDITWSEAVDTTRANSQLTTVVDPSLLTTFAVAATPSGFYLETPLTALALANPLRVTVESGLFADPAGNTNLARFVDLTVLRRDCVSAVSQWTECSESCGGGNRTRDRVTYAEKIGLGASCIPPGVETEGCNLFDCPVDCVVGNLSAPSPCEGECGVGVSWRNRSILVEPMGGGEPCPGLVVYSPCLLSEVCDPCNVSAWSAFSDCANNTQFRTRVVTSTSNESVCPHDYEERECGVEVDPPCTYGNVTTLSPCSASCGPGLQTLVTESNEVRCAPLVTELPCNLVPCPIDCELGDYGAFGPCEGACGMGQRLKTRVVITPAAFGGTPCGNIYRYERCDTGTPCVNCTAGEWGPYGPCVNGTRTRTRVVTPEGDDSVCFSSSQTILCAMAAPVCEWEEFGPFSACSAACNLGTMMRDRDSVEGLCGVDTETRPCFVEACTLAIYVTQAGQGFNVSIETQRTDLADEIIIAVKGASVFNDTVPSNTTRFTTRSVLDGPYNVSAFYGNLSATSNGNVMLPLAQAPVLSVNNVVRPSDSFLSLAPFEVAFTLLGSSQLVTLHADDVPFAFVDARLNSIGDALVLTTALPQDTPHDARVVISVHGDTGWSAFVGVYTIDAVTQPLTLTVEQVGDYLFNASVALGEPALGGVFNLSVVGLSVTPVTAPGSFAVIEIETPGVYTIRASAQDQIGNAATVVDAIVEVMPATPPPVIVSPLPGANISGLIYATVTTPVDPAPNTFVTAFLVPGHGFPTTVYDGNATLFPPLEAGPVTLVVKYRAQFSQEASTSVEVNVVIAETTTTHTTPSVTPAMIGVGAAILVGGAGVYFAVSKACARGRTL